MEHIENTQLFMEKYRALLQTGETLPIPVQGRSMAPFLVHLRDTVWLKQPDSPLKVGDIVLYQRSSGSYILHRICRAKGDSYTLIGDAHTVREPGIRSDQIFAVAVRVTRKGKPLEPGTFWWEFFARIWVRLIPLRPAILKATAVLTKPFRRTT